MFERFGENHETKKLGEDLGRGYFKNGNDIYYKNGIKIIGADLSTFKVIAQDYAKDKNYTYYKTSRMKI